MSTDTLTQVVLLKIRSRRLIVQQLKHLCTAMLKLQLVEDKLNRHTTLNPNHLKLKGCVCIVNCLYSNQIAEQRTQTVTLILTAIRDTI